MSGARAGLQVVLVAALLAALPFSPLTTAAGGDHTLAFELDDPKWILLEFTTKDRLHLRIVLPPGLDDAGARASLLPEPGATGFPFHTGVATLGDSWWVDVHHEDVTGEPQRAEVESPTSYGFVHDLPLKGYAGTYRLVLWAAGNVRDVRFTLTTDGDEPPRVVREGDRVWFAGSSDYDHAEARVAVGAGFPHVDVQRNAVWEFDIRDRLFGVAGGAVRTPGWQEDVRLKTPLGRLLTCTCVPQPGQQWEESGTYTVYRNATGFKTGGGGSLLIEFADVNLDP